LQEAGIQIDRIGAVSLGAFIGALFAMGYGPKDVRSVCLQELGSNPFDDYTFPAVSLIKAKKARRMMQHVFGRCTIESLPIDFFCLSSDLVSAQPVIHRRGDIVTSVGASVSIPGIAPPIRKSGKLLVDGGVLNNLPTDIMRDQSEGPIIASDLLVGKKIEDTSMKLPGAPIPGFSQLFARGSAGLPNILQILTRTSILGSLRCRWEQQAIADLVVCTNMEHIGFFDWEKIDEAIESGYQEALCVLKAARQDGRLNRIVAQRPKLVLADRG
jgi:NTE family protein